jgi:hypothetical protein
MDAQTHAYDVGDLLRSTTYKVWLVCRVHWRRARAAGGAAQHSHGTTHSHTGEPTAVYSMHTTFQRPVPVTPGQHLLCTSLITWGGGDDRRPVTSPHTVARPDAPLVRSPAELSQAVALPHSLAPSPPSPSPQAHTPLQPLGGPVHRRPHQGAWGVGGPGESKAPSQDQSRGERCGGGGRACTCARHQAGTQATWAGQEGTHTGPSSP